MFATSSHAPWSHKCRLVNMTLAGWKNASTNDGTNDGTNNGVPNGVLPPEFEEAPRGIEPPLTTWAAPITADTMMHAAALEYAPDSPPAYFPESVWPAPPSDPVANAQTTIVAAPVAAVAPHQQAFGQPAPFGQVAPFGQTAPFGQSAVSSVQATPAIAQPYQPLPQPGYTAQPQQLQPLQPQPQQPQTQQPQTQPFQNGQSAYGSAPGFGAPTGYGPQAYGPQAYGQQAYGTQPGMPQPPYGAQSSAPMYVTPQSGSKAGVIVAIVLVLGLLAFISIAIIGAVSVLGGKVQTSFNAISNTLPPGGYQSPNANYGTPVDTAPGFDQPIDDQPIDDQPIDGQPIDGQPIGQPAAASVPLPPVDPNVGPLTPFEASSSIQLMSVYKRNGTGPVGLVPGENCVVFEPNTTSYAAVYCSSGRMNAAMVKRGWPLDVQETCATEVQKVLGRAPDYEELLLVKYPELGVEECFVRTKNYSMVASFQP
jgi:Flp pilus assembly pilin Flp